MYHVLLASVQNEGKCAKYTYNVSREPRIKISPSAHVAAIKVCRFKRDSEVPGGLFVPQPGDVEHILAELVVHPGYRLPSESLVKQLEIECNERNVKH